MMMYKWMWIVVMILWVLPRVSVTKYVNDIHGDTIQVDKSSRFHVLELHGMTAGVTSSLFVGAMMLMCCAYYSYKIGIAKIFGCCCNCPSNLEGQGVSPGGILRPQMMTTQSLSMVTQQPLQQQQAAVLHGIN